MFYNSDEKVIKTHEGINLQTKLFKGLKKVFYFIVYFYVHIKKLCYIQNYVNLSN